MKISTLFSKIVLVACSITAAVTVLPVKAQDFPSKTIKIIVPFPPGAATDTLARLVAQRLQEKWAQPVIVENRSGASGSIGAEYVYKAAPDGYTLLFTAQSVLVTNKLLNPKVGFEPDAFVPIGVTTRYTVAMLVNAKMQAENLHKFIAYANSNPGKLNYASSGPGSTAHLTAELFKSMSNTKIVQVPYQGISPAMVALLGGQVDVLFDSMTNALPHIKAGNVKVLAVGSEKRYAALPDTPAITEELPGFASTLWIGFVAPPKTPAPLAEKLSQAIAEALKNPESIKRMESMTGMESVGSDPATMARIMKSEREQWAKVIKETGITTE